MEDKNDVLVQSVTNLVSESGDNNSPLDTNQVIYKQNDTIDEQNLEIALKENFFEQNNDINLLEVGT